MYLLNEKFEKVLPVFLGVLGALLCCTMVSVKWPGFITNIPENAADQDLAEESAEEEPVQFYADLPGEKHDLIREFYVSGKTREQVTNFFTQICNSREIAEVILLHAVANNIPPALAFALAWEESRFIATAVNSHNRNGSIDRGLFQLNSNTFPDMDVQSFFDPQFSARYGMSHLRHCLDAGGTEISALAMYNAGTGRVRSTGAPKITLDYVHRILQNRQRIEAQFKTSLANQADVWVVDGIYSEAIMEYGQNLLNTQLDEFAKKLVMENPGKTRFIVLSQL